MNEKEIINEICLDEINDNTCPICFNYLNKSIRKLDCGHIYHV